jgi:hypothetical protein
MARDTSAATADRGGTWRTIGWGGAVLLLLLPFAAMQFTREVNWTGSDFAVFGLILLLAGGALELTLRMSDTLMGKVASVIAVLTGFLLVWANLAVGIIGSENNLANLLYFGVIMVAVAGSIVARLEPDQMARAMAATAAAQVLATAMAMSVTEPEYAAMIMREIIGNGLFAALWLTSGWLFYRASRQA